MTLNNWYVVTRVTNASVWIQEICGEVSNDYGTGEGRAMPSMDRTPAMEYDRDGQEITAPVRRFKIRKGDNNDGQQYIWDTAKQRSVRIWDMRPKYHNTYD